jgi:cytoskeletal protein CcmA (bactofilin family)
MNSFQIRDIDESELDTILSSDITFSGTMHFQKPLMVKGYVKGEIRATGDLYIDEKAEVEARVHANLVSIKGTVKGDVSADTRVELFESASVDGDITAPDVIMESGCRFNGICTMKSPEEAGLLD